MCDGDDGAGVLLQVLLQPRHALGVEVVGGLVEEQQVGRLEQQPAQRDAAALTTGEDRDVGVAGRAAQGVHRLLDAGVELPAVVVLDDLHELALLGHQRVEVGVGLAHRRADLLEAGQRVAQRLDRLLDVAAHVELLVERRLLQQDADRRVRRERRLTVGGLLHAGHDLEDGRLAGAVGADDADLRAGQERQGDVVEDHLVAVRLARTDHRVDVLSHWASEPSVVLRAGAGPPDRGPTPCVLASDPPSPGQLDVRGLRGEVGGVQSSNAAVRPFVVPAGRRVPPSSSGHRRRRGVRPALLLAPASGCAGRGVCPEVGHAPGQVGRRPPPP